MSMINQIYYGMYQEYLSHQEERKRNTGNKEIHVTTITTPCEQKALYQMSGVEPPQQTLTDVGDLLMGTILHGVVENVIQKYIGGLITEKEYHAPLKNGWKLVAHPDLLAGVGGRLYDLKFTNPTRFKKIRDVEKKPPMSYVYQLNLYAYILQNGGINITDAYCEFISTGKNRNKSVRTFDMVEVPVELNVKYAQVFLRHAEDLINKHERGDAGLDVKGTISKLKGYFKGAGLNPSLIESEHYDKWLCEYCNYKTMCPLYEKNKQQSNGKKPDYSNKELEEEEEEIEM